MDFQTAENQYRYYADQCNQGKITYQQFQDAVNQITVYDASGQLWMLHAQSAKWCVFQGGQWVFMDPHGPGQVGINQVASIPPPAVPAIARFSPGIPPISTFQPSITPKKKSPLLLILGIGVFLCIGLAVTGYLLVKSGRLASLFGNLSLEKSSNETAGPSEGKLTYDPVDSIAVNSGASQIVDTNQAELLIPEGSLPEGVSGQFIINEPNATLKKEIEKLATLVTPFYQLKVEGENDGSGQATLTLPTNGEPLFLVELFDGKYIAASKVEYSGSTATIPVPLLSGLAEAGNESLSFSGTYAFAFITPQQAKLLLPNTKTASQVNQATQRDCTIRYQIASSGYGVEEIKNQVSFCRKNGEDTIRVLYNTTYTPKMTLDIADQVVNQIETIMKKYQSEGFTAAKLKENQSKVNVVVEAGSGDPVYVPSSATIYIPQDSIGSNELQYELAHELAHWIQDYAYNMTAAYWSNTLGVSSASTWWFETSAENMVMLFAPEYLDKNLTFYGTTSLGDDKRTPFQLSPNQWNEDLYNHAQLLKVFTCENPGVCPINPSQFIKAINEGSFPINDSAIALISQNLDDYARYLLGMSPQKANSTIYLLNSVKTGNGYGEFVTPLDDKGSLSFKKTGYDPQMKLVDGKAGKELEIQAVIEKSGVYPLMLETPINPSLAGFPVEIEVSAGTPFYYRIESGEIKYHDGSDKLILGPIHPKLGVTGIRIVAIAGDRAKTFSARIRPLDISGDWLFFAKDVRSNSVVCAVSNGEEDDTTPLELAQVNSYLTSYATTIFGVFNPDAGATTYTWTLSPGADLTGGGDVAAIVTGAALVDGTGITVQSSVTIPQSSSYSPPSKALPVALASGGLLGLGFFLYKKKFKLTMIVCLMLLGLTGCGAFFGMWGTWATSTKVEKIIPYDPATIGDFLGTEASSSDIGGTPRYVIKGTTTGDMNFTITGGVTTIAGESEKSTTCSGTIVYDVFGFLLDDGLITEFPGSSDDE